MELFFYQFKDGSWGVGFNTTQAEMPAILNDMIKDAVKEVMGKFNKI